MDIFTEQIVTKKKTTTDLIKKILIVSLTLLISIIVGILSLMLGLFAIGFIVILGLCYGGYYLLTNMSIEYEYILTNGEIDIDKIIAQKKRKRLLTIKVSEFEAFGLLSEAAPVNGYTNIVAIGGDEEKYYADFKHRTHGNVRLIFSPNSKFLEAIKPFLKRTIKK